MTNHLLRIGYTLLVVDSVAESLPLWEKGLGFILEEDSKENGYQPLVSTTGQKWALVEAPVLERYSGIPLTLPKPLEHTWQNPLFVSLEVTLLEETLQRLKSFGIHILKAPTRMPWGANVAFVQDLRSGLCFELMEIKASS
ncbi:MAG: VOC family protein [Vampirovibrio sp.]